MMDELPAGLIGLRDRALLLLGFAGAFRRAELVALHCGALKHVSTPHASTSSLLAALLVLLADLAPDASEAAA